jgi:hypothetical protein
VRVFIPFGDARPPSAFAICANEPLLRTWRGHSPVTACRKSPAKLLTLRRLPEIPPVRFPAQWLLALETLAHGVAPRSCVQRRDSSRRSYGGDCSACPVERSSTCRRVFLRLSVFRHGDGEPRVIRRVSRRRPERPPARSKASLLPFTRSATRPAVSASNEVRESCTSARLSSPFMGRRPMRTGKIACHANRHVLQDDIGRPISKRRYTGVGKRVANPLQVANLLHKRCAHDV